MAEEIFGIDAYEGFPQIENGVGMVRLFSYEIDETQKLPENIIYPVKEYSIATGTSVYDHMVALTDKIEDALESIKINVYRWRIHSSEKM